MTDLVPNFRTLASLWFAGELSGRDTKQFLALLYGEMLDAQDMSPLYLDLARIWNSLAIEGRRLDAEGQERVSPTHDPHQTVLPTWRAPRMDAQMLECCGCHHRTIFEYRVRGADGRIIPDAVVEYRTYYVQ